MSVSEQRAIELAQIDPPRSIDRIARFAEDISSSHSGSGFDVGAKHMGFASASIALTHFQSLAINPVLLSFFLERHQIGTDEFRDFSRWLMDWNRARVRMEYVRLPLAPGEVADSSLMSAGYYTGPIRQGAPQMGPNSPTALQAVTSPQLVFGAELRELKGDIPPVGSPKRDAVPKFEPPRRSQEGEPSRSTGRAEEAKAPSVPNSKLGTATDASPTKPHPEVNRFDTILGRANQRAVPAAIGFGSYTFGAVQAHEEMSPVFRRAANFSNQGGFRQVATTAEGPELVWSKRASPGIEEGQSEQPETRIESRQTTRSGGHALTLPSPRAELPARSREYFEPVGRTSGSADTTAPAVSKLREGFSLAAGIPVFGVSQGMTPSSPGEKDPAPIKGIDAGGKSDLAAKIPVAMGALGPNLVQSFLPSWTNLNSSGEALGVPPGMTMPRSIKPRFDLPNPGISPESHVGVIGDQSARSMATAVAVAVAVAGPKSIDIRQPKGLPFEPRPLAAGMVRMPSEVRAPSGDLEDLQPRAELAELTLVAPPLKVASAGAEQSGTAVSFQWETLVQGSAPLDFGSFSHLKESLPPGSEILYPAVPRSSIGSNAVNLKLAKPLAATMIESVSGRADPFMIQRSFDLANLASGTVGSTALAGSIVPGRRPMGKGPILPESGGPSATGALRDAGGGSAQRGGALDFLGMPIRLAPSLSGRADIQQQIAARKSFDQTAGANMVRPEKFASLRNTLFSPFQSVTAEPAKEEWRKAAPDFGLKNHDSLSILAPDTREGSAHGPTHSTPVVGTEPIRQVRLAKSFEPTSGIDPHSPHPIAFGQGASPLGSGESHEKHVGFAPHFPLLSRLAEPSRPFEPQESADLPAEVGTGQTRRQLPLGPANQTMSDRFAPTGSFPPMTAGSLKPRPQEVRDFQEGENLESPKRSPSTGSLPIPEPKSTPTPRVSEMISFGTSAAMRAPDRLIASVPTPIPRSQSHMPIQRSAIGSAIRSDDRPLQVESARQTDRVDAMTSRDRASEVHAMAREVWSVLRQRLSAEAVRKGRYS